MANHRKRNKNCEGTYFSISHAARIKRIIEAFKEAKHGYINQQLRQQNKLHRMLEEFNLDYISALAIIKNPSYEQLINILKQNIFLIEDGKGIGEGIVIKNYDFYNKWKRQTWAKIVSSEFKEQHAKIMGPPEINGKTLIEEKIIDDFCTSAFIEKEYAKIVNEMNGWQSKYIQMLFGRVYSELVKEETWNIVKKYKNPKIDFKTLNTLLINKVKEVKKELFA